MGHLIREKLFNYHLSTRQMRCVQRVVLVFFAVFVLSLNFGCVSSKTVMDLNVPQLSDPNGSKTVTIAKVTDLRKFTADSYDWGIPTVARSNEATDRSITVRTIGMAHGGSDIILPEGRTVEMLVGEAVQKALRGKGYSVVSVGATAVTNAIPIEVEIKKFWLWFAPGFWVVTVYYEAEIGLKGSIAINGSEETITGRFEISSPMAVSSMYKGTAEGGIENLIVNVKAKVKDL